MMEDLTTSMLEHEYPSMFYNKYVEEEVQSMIDEIRATLKEKSKPIKIQSLDGSIGEVYVFDDEFYNKLVDIVKKGLFEVVETFH